MHRATSVRRFVPLVLTAACLAASASGQTLTTQTVVSGLTRPTWVGSPPGDERIFVTEQNTAQIRIVLGGAILPTPFLDLNAISLGTGERGLLGMAFHPHFAQNGYFFVNYTDNSGDTVIARYQVSAGDPNVADSGSALVLLEVDQPFSNHNAGDLAFSPLDGYLYIPLGDGGSGNDPSCRAQNPQQLLGKMLRIDVDDQDPGLNYAVPADNPFIGVAGVREEIWAFGLRNPFRFGFDRLTGDIYVGDVGQGDREEVDFEPAGTGGRNYGWPVMEGTLCNNTGVNNCSALAPPGCFAVEYTDPVHQYVHVSKPGGLGCAVIGGRVYRGCANPAFHGTYFFADNCTGRYWSLEVVNGMATNVVERTAQLSGAGGSPSAFGEDGNGEILIANLGTGASGRISRIVPVSAPVISDCDGNGQDDGCEVATVPHADTDRNGVVDACQSFSVESAALYVGVGGSQTMNLHAGGAFGSLPYVVLGSLTGTSPGLPLGLITLPLNPDAYFTATITAANNPPFVSSVGVLDGAGEATAAFVAGPGTLPPILVGLTASHAYLVVDAAPSAVFASNPTSLDFLP